MTDTTGEEFFTKKHARLTRIALAANIFAWIALGFQVLAIVVMVFGQPSFIDRLGQGPVYTFSLVVDLATILIRGVVYWLVLKGISVGLYMITETDLNYRDIPEEVTNEQ